MGYELRHHITNEVEYCEYDNNEQKKVQYFLHCKGNAGNVIYYTNKEFDEVIYLKLVRGRLNMPDPTHITNCHKDRGLAVPTRSSDAVRCLICLSTKSSDNRTTKLPTHSVFYASILLEIAEL